jgi:hypothetical protein
VTNESISSRRRSAFFVEVIKLTSKFNKNTIYGGVFLAIWDYQMILFPKGNKAKLTEDGMDFVGPYFFNFDQAVDTLVRIDNIKTNSSSKSWSSFDEECYFLYDNGKHKVEIELNTGTKSEKADLISLRTNIYKGEGNISEFLKICRILAESLNLTCWNMNLRSIVNLNDIKDVEKTINHFKKLKNNN